MAVIINNFDISDDANTTDMMLANADSRTKGLVEGVTTPLSDTIGTRDLKSDQGILGNPGRPCGRKGGSEAGDSLGVAASVNIPKTANLKRQDRIADMFKK